ncbi:hemolysin family protein [Propionibacteriaceae bacterium Y2011]|uniref:hemolysin family protein n=1 Tax=Microlunatus sp. Y2014 TaxID=3418488 RepID=UPI003B4724AB
MSDWGWLLVAVLLLALNTFFVGAEFAVISARRTLIEPKAAEGSRIAQITLKALKDVSLMMAGAQLGITVCTVGLGAVGEPAVAHLLEPLFAMLRVPEVALHIVSFIVAMAIVVTLHVVIGEMVPKNIALAAPERAALILGPPLYILVTALKPLIWVLNAIANLNLRLMKVEPKDEVSSTFTAEEVAGLVDESRREGMMDDEAYGLVQGALTFTDRTVDAVLLPVSVLVSVSPTDTLAEVEQRCAETGYSRYPVISTDDDGAEVVHGYLHIKDVLETDPERRQRPLDRKWFRMMPSLSPQTELNDAIKVMQAKEAHLAKVVGPDGRLAGVVAMEDVLEELVGEIRDISHRWGPRPAAG